MQKYKDGEISRHDIQEADGIRGCCNAQNFLENFSRDVFLFSRTLSSFPRHIQIEITQWILSRNCCGCYFFTQDSLEKIESNYSDLVENAHLQYAALMYPKRLLGDICCYHGVMYDG